MQIEIGIEDNNNWFRRFIRSRRTKIGIKAFIADTVLYG
jgi:hypothetical protein